MSLVEKWTKDFYKDTGKVIAQKACTKFTTLEFLSKDENLSHFFNTKVRIVFIISRTWF